MAGWILNCWPTWHSSRLASKAGRKDTNIYKNNLSWNFGFSFVLSLEEAVIRMAGAVSRFKSIMNEKVVSFCLLGVLFWMPDIYAFLICRIWPSSECSKQSNLFLLPVTDYKSHMFCSKSTSVFPTFWAVCQKGDFWNSQTVHAFGAPSFLYTSIHTLHYLNINININITLHNMTFTWHNMT